MVAIVKYGVPYLSICENILKGSTDWIYYMIRAGRGKKVEAQRHVNPWGTRIAPNASISFCVLVAREVPSKYHHTTPLPFEAQATTHFYRYHKKTCIWILASSMVLCIINSIRLISRRTSYTFSLTSFAWYPRHPLYPLFRIVRWNLDLGFFEKGLPLLLQLVVNTKDKGKSMYITRNSISRHSISEDNGKTEWCVQITYCQTGWIYFARL